MRARLSVWVGAHRRAAATVAAAVVVLSMLVAVVVTGGDQDDVRVSADGPRTSPPSTEEPSTTTTTLAPEDATTTTALVSSTTSVVRTTVVPTTTSTTSPAAVIADGTWRVGADVAPGWYVQTGAGPCRWTITVSDGRSTAELSEWMVEQAFQLRDGSTIATTGCGFRAHPVVIDNFGGASVAVASKRGPAPQVPMGSFVAGRDIRYGNWAVDGFDADRSDCPDDGCASMCVVRVRTAWGLKLSEPRQVHAGDDVRFSVHPPMALEVMGASCPRWKLEGS